MFGLSFVDYGLWSKKYVIVLSSSLYSILWEFLPEAVHCAIWKHVTHQLCLFGSVSLYIYIFNIVSWNIFLEGWICMKIVK